MVDNIFRNDKICRHGDKLVEWERGANPFPVTMEVDLCGACNSHCPRCTGGERRDALLPTTVAERVLGELARGGVRGIIFTGGGEPTLHPDLPRILARARGLGMDVGLITNGLRASDDMREAVANCATWVRVSLDASTPEEYARSHGGTERELGEVVENIRRLAREPKCPTVGVGYLVEDASVGGMVRATTLCRDLGADYIQFRPYYYGFYNDTNDGLDVARYRAAYAKARGHERRGFRVLQSSRKFDKIESGNVARTYTACWGQQFCGVVTSVGDVSLCCNLRGIKRFVLGNVLETSFKIVWNSTRRQDVLKQLDMDSDCPPLCRCDGINEQLQHYRDSKGDHENFL